MTNNILTHEIIGAAIEVHRHWGPGLYEDIYEKSLCRELHLRNIPFKNQVQLPLIYKGANVGSDLCLDLLIDKTIVVEIKAVSSLDVIHEAQLLSYLRLTQCRIGLLINFNTAVLKSGIKRVVL
jgi:GxxExxY protein